MTTKPKLAVRNAIAYAHLTGYQPKYLHCETWLILNRHVQLAPGTTTWVAKPEVMPIVDEHPMVITVRRLEAEGWLLAGVEGVKKISYGIPMKREVDGNTRRTIVYVDGRASHER